MKKVNTDENAKEFFWRILPHIEEIKKVLDEYDEEGTLSLSVKKNGLLCGWLYDTEYNVIRTPGWEEIHLGGDHMREVCSDLRNYKGEK